jgi:UDPglucose 6-dehydrogenase
MLEAFQKTGDNVTMVPIMRNLWAFDWKCYHCGWKKYQGPTPQKCEQCGQSDRLKRKMVWIAKHNPQSTSYCFDATPHFQYFEDWKHRPAYQEDKKNLGLTETMSLQGSCWMLTRERYWDLNICDEKFGSWGSQGIEVASKTWLSGGRVLVNHATWYAHMFRTQGGDFSFPYPISGRDQEKAKAYARELFFENKWDKQIYPLSWLVEKFWPVRGWTEEDLAKLKQNNFNFHGSQEFNTAEAEAVDELPQISDPAEEETIQEQKFQQPDQTAEPQSPVATDQLLIDHPEPTAPAIQTVEAEIVGIDAAAPSTSAPKRGRPKKQFKGVTIIGYGWVGKSVHKLFPDAYVYDPPKIGHKSRAKEADIAFICVPTPVIGEGKLDISIVEECVAWCEAPLIVIRSTVNPGTADYLSKKYQKRIVIQPEYLGETAQHPLFDEKNIPFLVLGGEAADRRAIIDLYANVYNANIKIRQVTAYEAEVIKLSENRAIAFKVAQCQELYDVCEKAGIDYYTIRDAVYGDDPRFNLWWTLVFPKKRGFNSKCIPKDIYAWCAWAESVGYSPEVTRNILEVNKKYLNLES